MGINEKIELLAEVMDVLPEELHEDDVLRDNAGWDSLSKLSFMSLLHSRYDKKITPRDIAALKTVGDALKLME